MTDKQFDAILLAILRYAQDVRDIDKVIEFIKMLTQKEKTSDTPQK